MINVEIQKAGSENSMSVIRKFTRRMQGSGLVQQMRGRRYRTRPFSKALTKKRALKRMAKREEFDQLLKEGKVTERPTRGGHRGSSR